MTVLAPQPHDHPELEDFEDFFEYSMCGFINAAPDGKILRANTRLAEWLGYTPTALAGLRFTELLRIGGKIMYETHLAPLLRMQGHFEEVALEMSRKDGERVQVLLNARERFDKNGSPLFIRYSIFRANDRRVFEQNLQEAKTAAEGNLSQERDASALREQFIAVLGHDLRNPLNAITGAAALLDRAPLEGKFKELVGMMKSSAARMAELIENVMDFARGRLGGGMSLDRKPALLQPVLLHLVDELRSAYPMRIIETDIAPMEAVDCDAARISQILSNLLANALTHGSHSHPVYVRAFADQGFFELSVSNGGTPIPATALDRLFKPFTRQDERVSQNGLGLGLFIASEVARAHEGVLSATSSPEETRFTFRMPLRRN